MLSSEQIDTVSGITCNYKDYVVYYSDDYSDYPEDETPADLILIYCGSGFQREGTTFIFGDDAACYQLTYNKYIDVLPVPDSFTVPERELVYTNLASDYPDLNFWATRFNNTDFGYWIVVGILVTLAVDVIFKVIFGGKE